MHDDAIRAYAAIGENMAVYFDNFMKT